MPMFDFDLIPQSHMVVVLEPLLVMAPPPSKATAWKLRLGKGVAKRLDHYHVNEMMVRWINQTGYYHSTPTEVWWFGESEEMFDGLTAKIDARCGDYIVDYKQWPHPREAKAALMADPTISTVFDADVDRVADWWQFRGHRVLLGGTP